MLTLLLDRPAELLDQRRRVRASVLDLLLDPVSADHGIAHLAAFGFEPDGEVALLACVHATDGQARVLADSLDALRVPYLASSSADASIFVLVHSADADEVSSHLASKLSDEGNRDATVGVSGPLRTDSIDSGVPVALYAAESARWRHERIGRHDSLSLAGVLADDQIRTRLASLAASPMAHVLAHPRLVQSLEVFLRTNGSWETASRQLGVHRHTLRNRMARVEKLTGLSLDVAENRVVLLLGLMTR